MLGLLKAKCPLNSWEKTWTEAIMTWFARHLDFQRMLNVIVVEPNGDFFPFAYDGSEESARKMFAQVSEYMSVEPSSVRLEIAYDQVAQLSGEVRDDSVSQITVPESLLAEPSLFAAHVSRDLAFVKLLPFRNEFPDEVEFQRVAELLPTFLGLGLLTANGYPTQRQATGEWSWWSMERHAYVPSRILQYALSLFAWMRGDSINDWLQYLEPDPSSQLKAATKFLVKTQDSMFKREVISGSEEPTEMQILTWLRSPSASEQIWAMWQMTGHSISTTTLHDLVAGLLQSRDRDVRATAAQTLGLQNVELHLPRVAPLLRDGHEAVIVSAARSIVGSKIPFEEVQDDLTYLVAQRSPNVMHTSAAVLSRYGEQAQPALPELMTALKNGIVNCNYLDVDHLMLVIDRISSDTRADIVEHFGKYDEELLEQALEAYEAFEDANSGFAET